MFGSIKTNPGAIALLVRFIGISVIAAIQTSGLRLLKMIVCMTEGFFILF